MSWFSSNFPKHAPAQGGFGLIELMVSITIVVIVASIVLARQDSFNSAVLLRAQAYEVALQVREVQLSAVSASGDSGDFRAVLGVYFDSTAGSNGQYRIFEDADSDNFHDASEEFGLQGLLDSRFEIRDIRIGSTDEVDVSVIFERPNFDARFFSGPNTEVNVTTVEIDIARRGAGSACGSDVRTVEITRTGQIAVQDCP